MKTMLGLIGYSRVGKDEFADVLVSEFGAYRTSQGDYIKKIFQPLLDLSTTATEFVLDLQDEEGELFDTDAFWNMYFHFGSDVIDYARELDGIDAFTQLDSIKDRIRPLLEHGGYVLLPIVEKRMWADIEAQDARIVVNSRLFDVPQCERWKRQGGVIIELHRAGVGPKTDYERQNMQAVRDAGLIDNNYHNDATLDAWRAQARGYGRLLSPPAVKSA